MATPGNSDFETPLSDHKQSNGGKINPSDRATLLSGHASTKPAIPELD